MKVEVTVELDINLSKTSIADIVNAGVKMYQIARQKCTS